MKNIVIIGAGYGGVTAALGLASKFRYNQDITITLIDKHNYQLFAANLYEVATSEEELTSIAQMKKSIVIPLQEIFEGKRIEVVAGIVEQINQAQKFVQVGTKQFPYDYLITALGSVTDYFGIPGAEQYSLPLKNLKHALAVRNQIEFAIQRSRMDTHKPTVRIVVAGGGYTGCEFVAELSHEIKILSWKYQYPLEKIDICIIEAMPQLIPGLSDRMSTDAVWLLKNSGISVRLSVAIASVDEHFINLASGEKMLYDVLVWTTGVKACPLPFTTALNLDRKGRIVTNSLLQSDVDDRIFALGDCACVINNNGRPAPPTAQDAIEHGKYLAYALPLIMENQRPSPYQGKPHGFIVAMGGKYSIFNYGGLYFKGFFAYLAHEFADWRYYARVVGWWKAIKYVWFQMEVYGRND